MLIFKIVLLIGWITISIGLLTIPKKHTFPNWLVVTIILIVIVDLVGEILKAM